MKPLDLMRHLVRLVTPTGGTCLDPFAGSGTTALACELEGFPWIAIEKEPEYVQIIEARLNGTQRGLGLDVGAPTPTRSTGGSLEEIRARGYRHAVNDPAARSQTNVLMSGLAEDSVDARVEADDHEKAHAEWGNCADAACPLNGTQRGLGLPA